MVRRLRSLALATVGVAAVGFVTALPAVANPRDLAPSVASTSIDAAGAADDTKARIRTALGEAADDVSVVAYDRRGGRTIAYNAGLVNCTGSIVKVMVLLALLEEKNGQGLSGSQRALAERMIHRSDNDATTALLSQAGGRRALDRLAVKLGLRHTASAGSWGRTSTTSSDQERLMRSLVDGHPELSRTDRRYVLRLMAGVAADQRWGVGSVPTSGAAEVKNGWVPLAPHGWRVNSIGHVSGQGRDYTIAMLSLDNDSMDAGVARLNRVSRIVFSAFAPTTASGGRHAVPVASRVLAPHPLW